MHLNRKIGKLWTKLLLKHKSVPCFHIAKSACKFRQEKAKRNPSLLIYSTFFISALHRSCVRNSEHRCESLSSNRICQTAVYPGHSNRLNMLKAIVVIPKRLAFFSKPDSTPRASERLEHDCALVCLAR